MAAAWRQGGWLRAWLFRLFGNAGRQIVVSRATHVCTEKDALQGYVKTTIIIIKYIYNALYDTLSAYIILNKLKTILSKYIHIQNRQS